MFRFDIEDEEGVFAIKVACVCVATLVGFLLVMPWIFKIAVLYKDWTDTFVWSVT